MTSQTLLKHVPVLSDEVLSLLEIKPKGKYLDGGVINNQQVPKLIPGEKITNPKKQ